MDEAHLSLETLARLLSGGMTYDELLQEVVPHLLERCPECRETHRKILRLQEEFGHWNEEVVVTEGLEAPELWNRIAVLSYEEQVRRIDEDSELQTWGFCQLLLKKSLEAAFTDPTTAINLANLAVKNSLRLGDVYHPEWVQDLRARASAYLGNARRVIGELRSADDAFQSAESALEQGTGNPAVQAEILDLKSSLRRAQRRLDEALALTGSALALYKESGDLHGVGTSLLKKAKILEEKGKLGHAIDLLMKNSSDIKAAADPRLFAYARYNLLGCLMLAKRYEDAAGLLPEIQGLFATLGEPLNFVRLRWSEAGIALGQGRVSDAEAGFREVQNAFVERGMAYDAALASLDLALLYLREGRLSELKALAAELVVLFEARDVHREALGALVLFQRACEEERITEKAVGRLAEALRRERPAYGG